jgi:hypothetical protein
MEWLALLLLIPLIVIPLVVLFGFAGCSFEPGVAPNLPQAPVLVSAVPGDETSITLEWTNPEMAPVAFQIERTPPFAVPPAPITESPFPDRFVFTDRSLTAGTEYAYKVRARRTADNEASLPSDTATARTWAEAFRVDLTATGQNIDLSADTLVQRFEPGALGVGGNLIIISMQAAGNAPLVISKLTLSTADTSLNADPFDSAAQPVESEVAGPFVLDPGTTFSTKTSFAVDPGKPLLVAFDVGAPGSTRIAPAVNCTAYLKLGTPAVPITEAALRDRTAYAAQLNQVAVIPVVQMATEWRRV